MKGKSKVQKRVLLLLCLSILVISFPLAVFLSEGISNNDTTQAFTVTDDSELLEMATEASQVQFLENVGQIGNEQILLYGSIPGGSIGFAESKIVLMMQGHNDITTLSFVGASDVVPEGIGEKNQKNNYFLGDRGSFENVRSYHSIIYHNLWPGIDLIYKATADGAKYQFDVLPCADPANIQICVSGDASLLVNEDSVRIETRGDHFVDEGLVAFQGDSEIQAAFVQIDDAIFGFELGEYDRSMKLSIDPLLYSTFVGGSSTENDPIMAIDDDGYIYVAGETYSSDFPIKNAFNDTLWGITDIFVFKLDPTGTNLIYSTFIGGAQFEGADDIEIDSSGNVYVVGMTFSTDFPVTGDALNGTSLGGYDAVIFKLNSTGNGLEYSTYFGGSDNDTTNSILLDADGNVYVYGRTESTDFPTKNALNDTINGNYDLFVLKLNSTMTGVEYSTYLGGTLIEFADVIDLDDNGNVYILGSTSSIDFPTTPGALNTSSNGAPDVVVCKLNATGNGLIYSTYIGGSNWDSANYLVADSFGNVYVVGVTECDDFPTKNALNDTRNGLNDAFVFKLNATGNGLLYSTFLGGTVDDSARVLCVDPQGNAYIALQTDSPDFPVVSAYDSSLNGATDMAIVKLNSTGNGLTFSSYFGGEGEEMPRDMILVSEDTFYVCGETSSIQEFPILDAFDYSQNGGDDVFIIKYSTDENNPTLSSPQDITYTYKDTGNQIQWSASDSNPSRYRITIDGFASQWTNWAGGTITANVDGLDPGAYSYTLTVEDTIGYSNRNTVVVTVLEDTTAPIIDSPNNTDYELGETGFEIDWHVGDRSPDSYSIVRSQYDQGDVLVEYATWTNGTISFSLNNTPFGVYNFTLILYDENGNSARDTVMVSVLDTTAPEINSPADVDYMEGFSGETIGWIVSDLSPESYEITRDGIIIVAGSWDGSNIIIDVGSLVEGVYTFTLTVLDASGNRESDSVTVTVAQPVATFSTVTPPPFGGDLITIILLAGGGAVVIVIVIIAASKRRG